MATASSDNTQGILRIERRPRSQSAVGRDTDDHLLFEIAWEVSRLGSLSCQLVSPSHRLQTKVCCLVDAHRISC
jgi:hypothetical protein